MLRCTEMVPEMFTEGLFAWVIFGLGLWCIKCTVSLNGRGLEHGACGIDMFQRTGWVITSNIKEYILSQGKSLVDERGPKPSKVSISLLDRKSVV